MLNGPHVRIALAVLFIAAIFPSKACLPDLAEVFPFLSESYPDTEVEPDEKQECPSFRPLGSSKTVSLSASVKQRLCIGQEAAQFVSLQVGEKCSTFNQESEQYKRCQKSNGWWIDSVLDRKSVRHYLSLTVISESVFKVEATCHRLRSMMTPNGVDVFLEKGLNYLLKVMRKLDRLSRRSKRAAISPETKQFKAMSQYIYLECIKTLFNQACARKANHILQMVPIQADQNWMTGWNEIGVYPDIIQNIPKPAFVSFPSGASVQPGQVILTEKVKRHL